MAIDLAKMKARLEEKRAEVQRNIARLTGTKMPPEDPIQASAGTIEREEQAVDLEENEIEQAILLNERALLKEVEQALKRIEKGTYGICTNAGEPIPEKRLEALPWASLCVNCEAKLAGQPI